MGKSYIIVAFFGIILFTSTFAFPQYQQISDQAFAQTTPNSETIIFQAEKDSFLTQGSAKNNEGANPILRIFSSDKNRPVITFSQDEIDNSRNGQFLLSATLRLYVTDNGNNWGPDGRLIGIHKILQDWTEGNGWNVGNNISGTGDGTTWNCPIDNDISNNQDDCIVQWDGGNFESLPGSTILITNDVLNQFIEFDVTSDVQNFLDGTGTNFGWMVKKDDESQNGTIEFASKESALNQPELVIVWGIAPQITEIIEDIQELENQIESKDAVIDEAIVADVIEQEILDLKNKVNQLITDLSIKQNLQTILDTALSNVQDAKNAVLVTDETQANVSLDDVQASLNSFISAVENEKGFGISDIIADEIVGDATNIISNSQLREENVINLLLNEPTLSTFDILFQQINSDIDEIRILIDELENLGVVVEAVAEQASPLKGKLVVNIPPGLGNLAISDPIDAFLCSNSVTRGIFEIMSQLNDPLESWEIAILQIVNLGFCLDVGITAELNPTDSYLFDQAENFYEEMVEFLDLDGPALDLATAVNQPDIRNLWKDSGFLVPTLLDGIIERIAGSIQGTVYVDVDGDGEFIPAIDERISGTTVSLEDIRRLGILSQFDTLSGAYFFSNLASATYNVIQEPREGFEQTIPDPNDPILQGKHRVDIVATLNVAGIDFGNVIVEPPAPQTIFFDDFIETAGWSQTSCILNNPPGQTCNIGLTPALLPVPSLPNWGFVETFDFVPGCQNLGPNVEARFSHPFTVTTNGTYTLSSWVGTSPCTTCDIFSQLLVDGDARISVKGRNLLFDPPQNRTTFQQATFDMTQGDHQITMRSFTPGGMCFGNFRTFFDDITIVGSTSPLTGPMTGGPYFYPEINQTSINATKPTTVTVPLKVEWFEGYYAEPVKIHVIGNLTDIGISSTVTSVLNSTHYKLFDVIFDIPDTATIGEHFINIFVRETDSGDREIETIQLNVE